MQDSAGSYRTVTDEAALREIIAEPPKAIAEKAISRVDEQSRRFLAASPFFLLATTGEDGSQDVSPRGDPPGSVLVIEDGTALAFGDRRGNRRLDCLRNILQRPQVGMLFLVPGVNETMRVNGRATIVRDAPFFAALTVQGKQPDLAIVVRIDELYLHCAKAFLRSSLWSPPDWPDRASLPTAGEVAKSQAGTRMPSSLINAALKLDSRFNRY